MTDLAPLTEAERLLGLDYAEYTGDDVERLEEFIAQCNDAAALGSEVNGGEPIVDDIVYDRLVDLLERVKPESGLLSELWDDAGAEGLGTDTELDKHLAAHPMLSIQTVKSWNDSEMLAFLEACENLRDYGNGMSLFMAAKINGHGVRVVYDDGHLVRATSRARSTRGRDLTRQMRNILGEYNGGLAGEGIVEVRGEVCLPLSRLDAAREHNPSIKSAFSAVSSMIKPSSTPEQNKLLDFLAYRLYDDGVGFSLREDEYNHLESLGFSVPLWLSFEIESDSEVLADIKEAFGSLESEYADYDYYCDGIVAEVNDQEDFRSLEGTSLRAGGNIALKVGQWAQDTYTGIVQYIDWKPGKSKLSPVAVVSTRPDEAVFNVDGDCINVSSLGIVTESGNRVRNVPLYEPRNILTLEAYPGEPLSFRYGGEAGVVPVTRDGRTLNEDAAVAVIAD